MSTVIAFIRIFELELFSLLRTGFKNYIIDYQWVK